MNIAFIYMNSTKISVGRGAGYVYASIKENKRFYDTEYVELKRLPKLIKKGNFDIIMISTMTLLFPRAIRLIRKIKKMIKIPVLIGGVHSTVCGSTLLKKYPEIDYSCVGEGESFVNDFLDNYGKKSLYNIKNLVYRKNNKVYSNPVRPPEDLSKLPNFPWNVFQETTDPKGFLYVTAARGCPYTCTYCCNASYLKLYKKTYLRNRPIEQIIKELNYLKQHYKFKMFYFGDDMLFFNKKYSKDLFTAVSKLGKPYGCMGRVEIIDIDMADHLSNTGCEYVAMGIECGDENFRKKHLNRFMSNEQIINAFKLLKERNITTASFNMIGWPFPGEDARTKATIEINEEIKPDHVQVTWFYPFPGTKLYEHCIKKKLINHKPNTVSYHSGSTIKAYSGKLKPFKSYKNI